MTEAPAILTDPRERWLQERRALITASDVAAILGEDPRRSALSVYAEKVEGIDTPETPRMRRGRMLEPFIANEYAHQTGRLVLQGGGFDIVRHPSIPWLGATPDRETIGTFGGDGPTVLADRVPLELKAVLDFRAAREWEGDAAPLGYEIQAQIQIACTGAAWGSLAGFIPHEDELAVRDRRFDPAFLAAALPVLEEFRARIFNRRPPEADGLAGSSRAVRLLWARADGETIALDHDSLTLAEDFEKWKVVRDNAGEQADELENRLRQRMGAATFGALPDGSFLTLKPHGKGRALKRWWPKLRRR